MAGIPPEVLAKMVAEYAFRPAKCTLGESIDSSDGAMSKVYKGTDPSGQPVIIKIVDTSLMRDKMRTSMDSDDLDLAESDLAKALKREAELLS